MVTQYNPGRLHRENRHLTLKTLCIFPGTVWRGKDSPDRNNYKGKEFWESPEGGHSFRVIKIGWGAKAEMGAEQ